MHSCHKRTRSPPSYLDDFYVNLSELPKSYIDPDKMDDPYNYDEANSANLKRNPVPELPK